MRLTRIGIEGFGVLQNTTLENLNQGLTVYHGLNGSGKTTIVQFVRGMLYGYGQSERFGYLPPLSGSASGGALDFEAGGNSYRLERTPQNVALSLNQRADNPQGFLESWEHRISQDLFPLLCGVGLREVHRVEDLIQSTAECGVDWSSQSRQKELEAAQTALHGVRRDQSHFFSPGATSDQFRNLLQLRERLQQECLHLEQEIQREQERIRQQQWEYEQKLQQLTQERSQIQQQLMQIEREISELRQRQADQERQRAELLQRAFLKLEETEQQLSRWKTHHPPLEQVLRDLEVRMTEVNQLLAGLPAGTYPESEELLAGQRERLANLEREIAQLRLEVGGTRTELNCDCSRLESQSRQLLGTLEQQHRQLSEELSSRVQGRHRYQLHEEAEEQQRCHKEVKQQLQRLRLRLESLYASCRLSPELQLLRECLERPQFLTEQQRTRLLQREALLRDIFPELPVPGSGFFTPASASDFSHLQQQQRELQIRLQQVEAELQKLERQPDGSFGTAGNAEQVLQSKRGELARVEAELRQQAERWQVLNVTRELLTNFSEHLQATSQSSILREASDNLQRLTHGEYRQLDWDANSSRLRTENTDGQYRSVSQLSRGTLDQVALSLRLAIAHDFDQRGHGIPLLFDDVLVDSDAERSLAAIQIMQEYSQRGQQIILFTCQPQMLVACEQLRIPIRELPMPNVTTVSTGASHVRNSTVRNSTVQNSNARKSGNRTTKTRSWNSPAATTPHAATVTSVPSKTSQIRHTNSGPQTFLSSATVTREKISARSAQSHANRNQNDRTRQNQHSANQRERNQLRLPKISPYQLEISSGIKQIPSVERDDVRTLNNLRVYTVDDLLNTETDWNRKLEGSALKISTVRRWQAEARLLCTVPELEAEEARLLASNGISDAKALQEADAAELAERIQEFCKESLHERDRNSRNRYGRDTVMRWQQSSRRKRSLNQQQRAYRRSRHYRRSWSNRRNRNLNSTNTQSSRSSSSRSSRRSVSTSSSTRRSTSSSSRESRQEREQRERTARERIDREREQRERLQQEQRDRERSAQQDRERAEREQRNRDRQEREQRKRTEREARDQAEREQRARDRREWEQRQSVDREQQEREKQERLEAHRKERERLERDQEERAERERQERERLSASRERESRQTISISTSREKNSSESTSKGPQFYLEIDSPIVDAPSIGPKTSKRLRKIGINKVSDLLAANADEAAEKISVRHIKADTIRDWQAQAALMCQVPEMRCHDVQILIACEITDVDQLAQMMPEDLFSIVKPFADSKAAERIIRTGKKPDLDEITEWITCANQSRPLRAA